MEKKDGVAPLLKSRDPHLAGGKMAVFMVKKQWKTKVLNLFSDEAV